MTGHVASSAETIIHAAAANRHLPVGEDLQQRQHFSADHDWHAKDGTQLLPSTGLEDPGTSGIATGQGLAVQVKVIQAGAAVWLPAQQGCNWPVNAMLEVSVFSPRALPAGADITVIADAVSPAQRVALAHGSPLPLRLQRALTHSAQHAAKASTTAFNAPQGRRVAHVEVPEAGVWTREHFVFPALTFQKHSDLRPLSLLFAVTAESTDSGTGAGSVATATLLPRTVSIRGPDEVAAALRVLRLPDDIFDRIRFQRSMGVIYARKPCTAVEVPYAGVSTRQPAVHPTMHVTAEHEQEWSRKRSPRLTHEDTELRIPDDDLHDTTRSTSPRSVFTGCEAWRALNGHTPAQVLALPTGSPDACCTDCAFSRRSTRDHASPDSFGRERERDLRHVHIHPEVAPPPTPGSMLHRCMTSAPPAHCHWLGMVAAAGVQHSAAASQPRLRLPTLEACKMALEELLSEEQ